MKRLNVCLHITYWNKNIEKKYAFYCNQPKYLASKQNLIRIFTISISLYILCRINPLHVEITPLHVEITLLHVEITPLHVEITPLHANKNAVTLCGKSQT